MVSAEDKDAGQERAGADEKRRVLELLLSQVNPPSPPSPSMEQNPPQAPVSRKRQSAASASLPQAPVCRKRHSIHSRHLCKARAPYKAINSATNQNTQPSSVINSATNQNTQPSSV